MATYLIKLFPIDRFFFGSDVTFGPDNENYFVRSAYFPQQTTLLGMLRYYLLVQNNMLDTKGKVIDYKTLEANDLIGVTGFDSESKSEGEFGIIKKISPVFIVGPDGEYFVQSREYGLQWREDKLMNKKIQELVPLKLGKKEGAGSFDPQQISYFEGFNSKTEFPDLLVNARSGAVKYFEYLHQRNGESVNGIFVANEQVGIRLPERGKPRDLDKGFYKQIGYTMLPGYGFGFYAKIDNDSSQLFENGLVRMGADQSWFRIERVLVNEKDQSINDSFSVDKSKSIVKNLFRRVNSFDEKVVLLSDCYLERDMYETCHFASVSTVPFQYMKIVDPEKPGFLQEAKGAYRLDGAGIKLKKSKEYRTLLKKGSVLYVRDKQEKDKLIAHLAEANKTYHQIGYNYAI